MSLRLISGSFTKGREIRYGYSRYRFEFKDGKPIRFSGIVQDITEKKRAEETLLKSEANLRTIFDNSYTGYVLLNADLVVLSFNTPAAEWISSEGDFKLREGQNFLSCQPEQRKAWVSGMMNEVLAGEYIEYESTIPEYSPLQWYIVHLRSIKNKEGSVIGVCINVSNVTGRKKAEHAKRQAEHKLQESHARLLFHIENSSLGFIEWDNQLLVKSLSRRAEEIFGWTEREFIEGSKSGFSQIHEEDLPWVMKMVHQLITGEVISNRVQFRNITKDGRVIWCEWFNSVLKNGNGEVITIMTLVQDITEGKEAEQQKEFDRNNLKALLNNTHDLMWSIDVDHKIITSNQAFDEMVKKLSGEKIVKGSDIFSAGFGEDQLKRFRGYYARAMAGEAFTEIEHTETPFELWSEISYYPIYKDDAVIGTACFSRNITKHKRAESHLRLLESVITNANDSVLITEAESIDEPGPRIVYVNSAFTKMTGYSPKEVIGKTPRLLQGPKSDRNELDKIRTALINRESVEVEIINYKKDGEEFWTDFIIVPVADRDGKFTHSVSIQRDVTARKRQEETTRNRLEKLVEERTRELNEALSKEKELVEIKNKFVSIASHEFRTPLSTISFAAESIRNYFHQLSAEEITRKLIKIEDQTSHMTNLLEDILTLGKSDAGKIKVKRISLDLKEFIDSLIEEVRATVKEERTIDFIFSSSRGMVNADDKLLRNVFINLLTNALKFSASEKPVSITVSDIGDDVLIEVTDEGIGIEEGELSSVFESFQRGSNATAVQGTGLGLSILKKAVELMQGSIDVKSRLNEGSVFRVQIPMQ